ncbi:DUF4133 domain-containing protein [Mucilaginibacter lappiensis]|uniref:DUF4133 domain-containing protein n=1 Tax=Mucilaginibacter lappiensis TaxID=354630 RepID=A0A841J9R1_9SPHI|nr:DUF4133 domain-containing protein [Mucilaginibacter lappiensis]MBB6127434.1 hypothetical protein [Mucilaginibacter lappiensis]
MNNSIYTINKGINKSIEFRGLKAQYIWYFGGMVIILMIVFAILYISGAGAVIGIMVIGSGGVLMSIKIFAMSKKYGEHGLMKAIAKRQIPQVLKSYSRKIFQHISR